MAVNQPGTRRFALPDGEMAALVWEKPGATRLVFLHGNGFNARSGVKMLERLADRYEIIAPDLRGHGATTLPADPATHRSWHVYGRDIVGMLDQLDARPFVLGGHSMGGVTALLTAEKLETKPLGLALIDPVILPGGFYALNHTPFWHLAWKRFPLVQGALRRGNFWPDVEAVKARYVSRPPFSYWAEGVLDDYLADGLKPVEGGVTLSCDPAWEAANYASHRHNPVRAAARCGVPVRVLKAEKASTVRDVAGLTRAGAVITPLPGHSHLAPMENPVACADWIAGVVEGFGG
ncbi:MAG: alpha/beta hydrolase [Oceanicaulis sp.]|uniref:alpha/beta fold hydrolase n=1 Tax=Glycocaulis sp. TaxID=1969725 RepID=UPI0025C4EA11|nr:alpha/beta hydrolase [Glycocaulis sp.]MCC5981770.1 alpha/beta hydrolase [Oceanicaulis sp.]MCH8522332.1 alpha/beta hydrolase [Glycocaulis sp.]